MLFSKWIEVIDNEYLRGFIRDGGAAVKFLITPPQLQEQSIEDQIRLRASDAGFLVGVLTARHTKLHLIDHLFSELAGQLDWPRLARALVTQMYSDMGYKVDAMNTLTVADLAVAVGVVESLLLPDVRLWLSNHLMKNYDLSLEFRTAMTSLCQAEVEYHGATRAAEDRRLVTNWLTGQIAKVTELRSLFIFQKLGRNNARDLLQSVARLLPLCGLSGLVLCLDISRYSEDPPRTAREEGNYYTKAAVLDMYEVLRQFIDSTDQLSYTLVIVQAPTAFASDEKRGVGRYDALRFRIWNDVADANLENPLAPLVHLS